MHRAAPSGLTLTDGAVFAIEKPDDIANVYVTMLLRRLPQGG